jgi:hypothetical protein
MLINSWRLCRAKEPVERIGYAVLWAVMVLLMNAHITQAIASLMVALLALAVCSDLGRSVPRFWPRHFVMFYAVHLAVLGIVATM